MMADDRNRKALADTDYCWGCGGVFKAGEAKMLFRDAGGLAACFCGACGGRATHAPAIPAPWPCLRSRAQCPRWTAFEYAICGAAISIFLYVVWLAVR